MSILINIGKKLIGEGAGTYLPFALSKLRYFATTMPLLPFSRTIASDDAIITLELHSRTTGAVTIISSGFNYEFSTPGDRFITDTYAGIKTARGYGVKVKLNPYKDADIDKFVATPTGSNAEASPTGAWKYENDVLALAKFAPHRQIWQIEHIPAHVYYASIPVDPALPSGARKLDARTTLADSWTCATETTNLNITSQSGTLTFDYTYGVPSIVKHFPPFDIIYDIGPSLYKKGMYPEKRQGIVPDSDWYKRAATRVVQNDEFGPRTFIIMTDITNRFYVYPVAPLDLSLDDGSTYAAQLIKTNLPDKYVKSQPAPFPGWARQAGGQKARDWYKANPLETAPDALVWRKKYMKEFPQYRWAFNSVATRAACVAYHDYEEIIGKDGFGEPPPATPEKTGNAGQKVGLGPFGGFQYFIKEAVPGMVELALDIIVTGPDLEDFEFILTPHSEIDPNGADRYILAVDYSWGPRPGKDSYGADLDDMILMEMDVYPCDTVYPVPRPDSSFPIVRTINERANITVKNHTKLTTLKTFTQSRLKFYNGDSEGTSDNYYSEDFKLRFHAYDLRVLGFVTEGLYLRGKYEAPYRVEYSAKRLQVSIYGVDEPDQYLSTHGETNTKMAEFVDNPDPGTMIRLPVNLQADMWAHTGTVSWTYTWGTDTPLNRCLRWRFEGTETQPGEMYLNYHLSGSPSIVRDGGLPRSDYRLGASRYATLLDDTILNGVHSSFTVHPEGHWAVTSPIIIHYDGVIRPIGGGNRSPIDTTRVQQTYIDIVAMNLQNKDFTFREIRTTHLALFNKAYKKSMAPPNLYWTRLVTGGKLRMYHPYDTSKYFDFRHDTTLSFEARLPPMDGAYSYVLRGSSIFFGRHHKEKPKE